MARTQLPTQPLSPKVDLTTHSCSDSDKEVGGSVPHYTLLIQKYRGEKKTPHWRVSISCKQGFVLLLNFHLPNSPSFIGQSAERKRRDRGRTGEKEKGG